MTDKPTSVAGLQATVGRRVGRARRFVEETDPEGVAVVGLVLGSILLGFVGFLLTAGWTAVPLAVALLASTYGWFRQQGLLARALTFGMTTVTVVTLGLHVHRALAAAESLADDGVDVEVIDLRSLVPLDTETVVESVEKTGNLVVVDEDYRSFGVTGEIVARVADEALDSLAAVERLAVPDVPIPYSRPLENEVVPSVADIEAAVERTQG